MAPEQPFSKRNRYSGAVKEITIREAAPENLRYFVLQTARDLGLRPPVLRTVLCLELRVTPGSWSADSDIWDETKWRMDQCEWYKVYDIIEALHARFSSNDEARAESKPHNLRSGSLRFS